MSNGVDGCDLGADEGNIQEAYRRLEKLRRSSPKLTCAEELEAWERELQGQTDELARLIIEHHVQQALESEAIKEAERQLIRALPGKLKNEGPEAVRICTGSGLRIAVRVSYYRRRCDRRKKKRSQGVYAGLVLLGIHERCTPLVSSRVSMMSALLSSFQEARQVLLDPGIDLGVKVVRKLSYRYAARARVVQQSEAFCFGEDLPIKGRRIAVSCDGGKTRLRENKCGPKTKKKRTRYNGAWREPKLLIIYVLDEQGKPQSSFAPVIDGTLNGPDAVFGLIQSYLRPLALGPEDQLLFIARYWPTVRLISYPCAPVGDEAATSRRCDNRQRRRTSVAGHDRSDLPLAPGWWILLALLIGVPLALALAAAHSLSAGWRRRRRLIGQCDR